MKWLPIVALLASFACAVADEPSPPPSAIIVKVASQNLKAIPDREIGQVLTALQTLALVVPSTDNVVAYNAVHAEIFDRAVLAAEQSAKNPQQQSGK